MSEPFEKRFWAKVNKTGGCWLWQAASDQNGYGRVSRDGKLLLAHRAAWQLLRGPIPVGLVLDHLCRVRGCVNPDHLEPVTEKQNMRRGIRSTRTVCIRGHQMAGFNLMIRKNGYRQCRACTYASNTRGRKKNGK